jgi:hypothetical protein
MINQTKINHIKIDQAKTGSQVKCLLCVSCRMWLVVKYCRIIYPPFCLFLPKD